MSGARWAYLGGRIGQRPVSIRVYFADPFLSNPPMKDGRTPGAYMTLATASAFSRSRPSSTSNRSTAEYERGAGGGGGEVVVG